MRIAITRAVSPAMADCELTHLARVPIDVGLARAQHRRYEECLSDLGCTIHRLPADPALPDSVFVEDAAVVLDDLAIITRPGARSRRPETAAVAEALGRYRSLIRLEPPATLDGGDVLTVGSTFFVGRSARTNDEGIRQLESAVAPRGYHVRPVDFEGCLHLKSAATSVGKATLLVQPAWVKPSAFGDDYDFVEVDPAERMAANALLVGKAVVCAAAFPSTRARLERRGIRVVALDVSEIAKAEGGLTCCSLIFDQGEPTPAAE